MPESEVVLGVRVSAVAHALGVSRSTCYRLIHAGVIPCANVGRSLVVPRAALEALLRGEPQPGGDGEVVPEGGTR
jgi:excisionase family DNA binding protein